MKTSQDPSFHFVWQGIPGLTPPNLCVRDLLWYAGGSTEVHHPEDPRESHKGSLTPQLSWNNSRFTLGLARPNTTTLLFLFPEFSTASNSCSSLYPTKTPDF